LSNKNNGLKTLTRQFGLRYKKDPMDWQYYNPRFEYEASFNDGSSPGATHRHFLYDLVRNLNPQKILVLKSGALGSLFPFCQALKDGQWGGELMIMDCQRMDKTTPPSDRSIEKIKDFYYAGLNIQISRGSLEQGLRDVAKETIDILFIDGPGTFKEGNANLNSWLDPVSEEGLLLIHGLKDTGDTGISDFWQALKDKYETLELPHSQGLGLLFKNRQNFLKLNPYQDYWSKYYSLMAGKALLQDALRMKDQEIGNLEENLRQVEYDLAHHKPVIVDLMNKVTALESELETIHNSNGWKLLLRYYKAWDKIIPGNTANKLIIRKKLRNFFKMISRPFIENKGN
jgi:hypothetical protein